MKKLLLSFGNWSVCESDDKLGYQDKGRCEVYAEHESCREVSLSGVASWSWEFDDGVRRNGYEACWECEERVPDDVIAVVVLHNWGRKRRLR